MLNSTLPWRPYVAALLGAALVGCATTDDSNTAETQVTPPVGKQLLVGGALTLRGMTSDGWVVYTDNATLTLHAAPIAGGAARDIVALGNSFAISVWGKTVFAWSNKNDASVGALTIWSSEAGPHAVSKASLAPWVAASMDGKNVLFTDHVDATGQKGDLVATGPSGENAKVIQSGLTGLNNDGCHALLGFAGNYAIAASCTGGAKRATMSSFAMPAFTRTELVTDASNDWTTDAAGTMLLTATGAGTVVVPLAGGTPTVIDAAGGTGVFADDKTVLYGASDSLRRSDVKAPAPTTLVSGGVGGLYGVSPDGKYVIYYKNMDYTHLVSDMYLTSATTAGAPMTLSSTQTAGVFGNAFTTDASHLLYSTEVNSEMQTSTLNALTLGTDKSAVLAKDVWVTWAGTGSKVVFSDHYAWTGDRGHADVRVVDTAKGGEPILIVNQADAEIMLSPGLDQIVYTWSLEDSPRAGLYVATIP